MTFATILLCLGMTFHSLVMRIIHRSWLAPAAFYSLWWTCTTFLSIAVGIDEEVPPIGLFWLFLSSILIGLGSLFFVNRDVVNIDKVLRHKGYNLKNLNFFKNIYLLSLIFSFLYIVSNLYYNGVKIQDLNSLEGLFRVASKFTIDRYEENVSLPIYIKILLSFVFFSNSLGGILFGLTKQLKFLLSLIPPILISLVFTEKAGIFFCTSAWISSYFIVLIMVRENRVFSFKTFARMIFFGSIIIFILMMSSFMRLGTLESSEFDIVQDKLSSYLGHVPAFSNWLSTYNCSDLSMELGKYTFSGILDLVGLSKREIGLYEVNYRLANGTLTNIFSIHKGLILDFSFLGSIIIYFLFGFISTFFYIGVRNRNVKLVGLLTVTFFIILGSIFTSILVYNTIFLSCLMTIVAFAFFKFERF